MGNKHSSEKDKKKVEENELLRFHKKIRREVIGCMKCVKQILPFTGYHDNGRDGWGYVCGTCRESFWICKKCIHQFENPNTSIIEHKLHHRLFREPIDLQWNMSRIKAECRTDTNSSSSDILRMFFSKYQNRWLLGERLREEEEEFTWKTYSTVLKEADSIFYAVNDIFGLRFQSEIQEPSSEEQQPEFCLLVGSSSSQWYISYYAMMLFGVGLVPLSEDITSEQLSFIIEKVDPKIIFISIHMKNVLIQSLETKDSIKQTNIVWINDSRCRYFHQQQKKYRVNTSILNRLNEKKWDEVIEYGKKLILTQNKNSKSSSTTTTKIHPTTIRLLLSSSGTTGSTMKLIMVTESMVKQKCIPPFQGIRTVMFCIKPLRQTFNLISKGGRIGIFTSLTHISSDLQLVRPTIFGSTPSFFLRLYEDFKIELRKKMGSVLIDDEENEEEEKETEERKRNEIEIGKEVSKQWIEKGVLGNRCRVVIIGGAASSEDLRSFIFESLGAVCIDGYGTTESGAISSSGSVLRGVKLLLIDSPDFGYFTSDEPFPRGEIVVNTGMGMTTGYYGDEEATKKQFLKIAGIRYSRTGDIGKMKDGKVEVIDRIKSLFKLRNGVFVAPSPIECIFENSPFVSRVFIWGDSSMSSILAACVIKKEKKIEEQQKEEEEESKNITIIEDQKIREDFARLARENGLNLLSHVPKIIVTDHQPWTIENGLINSAGKPIRANLIKKYRHELLMLNKKQQHNNINIIEEEEDNLEIDHHQQQQQQNMYNSSDLQSGLLKILKETFSIKDSIILNSSTPLYSLDGADSLSFARLVGAIRRKFSSRITLHQLFSKCQNLGDVQRIMFDDDDDDDSNNNRKRNTNNNDSFWENEVKYALEEFEKICKQQQLEEEEEEEEDDDDDEEEVSSSQNQQLNVLLTGASGFLGSFLLSELLKRGASVVCIIRRKKPEYSNDNDNDNDNETQLPNKKHQSSIQNILEKNKLIFHEEETEEKLEDDKNSGSSSWTSLVGDITRIGFGVSEEDVSKAFSSIIKFSSSSCSSSSCSCSPNVIIHCAAYVGSSVPYSSVRPHNVLGTVHAAALANKYKAHLVHISTVGFLPSSSSSSSDRCKEVISCSHLHRLGSYAQSKWVSDQFVLRISSSSSNNISLPREKVSVVRVGTCFGARKTGVANPKDSVIRLIAGLTKEKVMINLTSSSSSPLPNTFNLVPVDWVAEKIIKDHLTVIVLEKKTESKRVTCTTSPHQTSLQEIMKVVQNECGIILESITPQNFSERMRELAKSVGKEMENHPLYVFASSLSAPSSPRYNAENPITCSNDKPIEEENDDDGDGCPYYPDILSTIKWMISEGIIEKKNGESLEEENGD